MGFIALCGTANSSCLKQAALGFALRMREGDLLCVISGVKVPLVLRKIDNHYIIIGDCYVDGIMDGEIIPEIQAGKYQMETLNIH